MKIRLKIIETRKCIIAVSEEMKIRVGDYYLSNGDTIYKATALTDFEKLNEHNRTFKRILGYMPKTDCVFLFGVPYLPEIEIEDNVEKLAEDYTEKWCGKRKVDNYIHDAFIAGYKAATKVYTKEDIKKAIKQSFLSGVERIAYYEPVENGIIESLERSKIPKWFIADVYETKKSDDPFTSIDVLIKLVRKDGNSVIINGSQAYELSGSYEY